MDITDWLGFFPFEFIDWVGKALPSKKNDVLKMFSSSSMLHWLDKAFPVQLHEQGIHWFIQL